MVKIFTLIIFSLLSTSSFACFQPPAGLIEQHEAQTKLYFTVAIILLVFSFTLRLISNRNRFWVPALFVTSFTYFPAYLWHWGQAYSGACGIPEIVLAFQILACGFAVLFTYEAFHFYKCKRSKAR
jgi:hypothetical protein